MVAVFLLVALQNAVQSQKRGASPEAQTKHSYSSRTLLRHKGVPWFDTHCCRIHSGVVALGWSWAQ